MKINPLVILGSGVIAVIVAGGFTVKSLHSTAVPTYRVEEKPFIHRVSAEGCLRASKATPLGPPVDTEGPFKIAWLATDGSPVKAGDVIARFDPSGFDLQLNQGLADRAKTDEKAGKTRLETNVTAKNLQREADQAERELDASRTFQSKDAQVFSRFDIIKSEIDAELAESRKEYALAVKDLKGGLAKTEIDLLDIERRKAELKVNKATAGLKALELKAPHDGLVVFERDWRGNTPKVGESVWPGEKIAEIPELEVMEAEVFVLESDAGGLAVDQPAMVVVEGKPDMVFVAKVARVDALAKPRMRWVPVQYFAAVLQLERTDQNVMKLGQRVKATITIADRPSALVIPRQAVIDREGKKTVFRRRFFGFDPIEIKLGPAALGRVVIESGLSAGDEVALIDPTRAQTHSTSSTPQSDRGPGGPV